MKNIIAYIETKCTEKGWEPEWSICKIKIKEKSIYFFRLIQVNLPEAKGEDLLKVVKDYLDILPKK